MKLKENTNNAHKDSRFDLYIPSDISPDKLYTSILDLNIKCAVYKVFKNSSVIEPSAYYLTQEVVLVRQNLDWPIASALLIVISVI